MKGLKNYLGLIILGLLLSNCNPKYIKVKTSIIPEAPNSTFKTFSIAQGAPKDDGYDRFIMENFIYKRLIAMGYKYAVQNQDMTVFITYVEKNSENAEASTLPLSDTSNTNTAAEYLQLSFVSEGKMIFNVKCTDYQPGASFHNSVSAICRMLDQYETIGYDFASNP